MSAWAAHVKICVMKQVVYIQSNIAFVFLNNALPHQLVTMHNWRVQQKWASFE